MILYFGYAFFGLMVPAWEEKRSGSSRKAIIKKGAELRQRQRFS